MNRLVNEQTEIALLLALPGLMVTLCFAPWIVHVFYSSAFFPAATLLQWFILGCVIRVIQWPMGYLQLALGKSKIYFFTQTIFTIFQLFLTWFGLIIYGIEGVSIGFFVLYVVSIVVIYILSRRLTGFRWSIETYRLFTIFLPIILFTFITVRVFPGMLSTIMGIILTIAITTMCLRGMIQRIGLEHRLAKVICRIPGMRMVCGL
jgi:PST family polysaccharide transporter